MTTLADDLVSDEFWALVDALLLPHLHPVAAGGLCGRVLQRLTSQEHEPPRLDSLQPPQA